eukprot:CAMPEP_0119283532 /NCGR_PEP_ID=MMETSP1329-20130426/28663_1 /TAXON_ID=114041 /ORGANISM="Genus nov. species nov., Strain RCC1024" /LENGTH=37 /DNA_ID= /DNA_START= /DNA_END= /DNA_ORIENTATION=
MAAGLEHVRRTVDALAVAVRDLDEALRDAGVAAGAAG